MLCITDPSDPAMAPLRTLAAERDGIRLIGTPQPTRGARLTAALSLARGETVSVLGEGERRIPGSLRTTQDALVASGAAMAFTRVQEHDNGPDVYAWATPVDGRQTMPSHLATSRAHRLRTPFRHRVRHRSSAFGHTGSSLIATTTRCLRRSRQSWSEDTLVLALDTVSTLHRRSAHPLADNRADTLRYFARVLERSDAPAVRTAVLERLPKAWLRWSTTEAPRPSDRCGGAAAENHHSRRRPCPAANDRHGRAGLNRLHGSR